MTTLLLAADLVPTVYSNAVLTEDVTWRGSILVKGFVVVAPQATLRIDPGTVVRFIAAANGQLPTLVIQGRLHAVGTAERPVTLTSDQAKPVRGAWGGVVLLATEKRNLLEQCRIEYASTGIEIRFSTVSLKTVSIMHAQTGLQADDGVIQMTGGSVSDSESGVELHSSEFDGRDVTITSGQRGIICDKSAIVLTSSKIINHQKIGLEAVECRIKLSDSLLSGNALGAQLTGGEGQIVMSRFLKNRETALHLSRSRIKIQRCLFAGNAQDAVRTDDDSVLLWNNAFASNGGFNLFNAGSENVAARNNWWGTADQVLIGQKIHDVRNDKNVGAVHVFPWLNEKPLLTP
jgi:hypothetical protein